MAQSKKNSVFAQTFTNVMSNRIVTTDDKLKNILHNSIRRIEKGAGWKGWLSLLVTSIATFVSVDFSSVKFFTKEFWEMLFVFLSIISLILTLESLIYLWFKKSTVKSIIDDIKGGDGVM